MSIQEHLNKIRNAVYGHEVRESIAKGIETAYDDASENDNANMEVKAARGTHPNLRSRLDEATAQLAQTVKLDDMGVLGLNIFEEDARNILLGQEQGHINAVLGNGNVTEENLGNGVVSPKKTTFIKTSSNKYDKLRAKKGYAIQEADGMLYANVTYEVLEYVEISASTPYSFFTGVAGRVAWYDANKVFILATSIPSTIGKLTATSPVNAKFVSLQTAIVSTDDTQINRGSTLLPYEPYYKPYSLIQQSLSYGGTELVYTDNVVTSVISDDAKAELHYVGGQLNSVTQATDSQSVTHLLKYTNGRLTSVKGEN